jgi:hypothetical protein
MQSGKLQYICVLIIENQTGKLDQFNIPVYNLNSQIWMVTKQDKFMVYWRGTYSFLGSRKPSMAQVNANSRRIGKHGHARKKSICNKVSPIAYASHISYVSGSHYSFTHLTLTTILEPSVSETAWHSEVAG